MDMTSQEKNLLLCLGDILFAIQALEGEQEIGRTTLIDLLNSATERLNNHLNAESSVTPSSHPRLQPIELEQRLTFPNWSSAEFVRPNSAEDSKLPTLQTVKLDSKLLIPDSDKAVKV